MADPTVLFVKPKAISTKDKKALQAAGVIVVEIDDPASARFVKAGVDLDSGEILRAAAHAIANASLSTGSAKELFGKAMCAAIERTKTAPPLPG